VHHAPSFLAGAVDFFAGVTGLVDGLGAGLDTGGLVDEFVICGLVDGLAPGLVVPGNPRDSASGSPCALELTAKKRNKTSIRK